MLMSRARAPVSARFRQVGCSTGGFGPVAKTAASALWTWLKRWRARAAERRGLAQMTDWELKDIGVSRAEADGEAEKWFWRP
jgi:uncharacterized protein YjiS (DUF1127 family)